MFQLEVPVTEEQTYGGEKAMDVFGFLVVSRYGRKIIMEGERNKAGKVDWAILWTTLE